jgi:DNA-binding response OmpR family regulator
MLPGLNGFEVCRRLRAAANHTPVLMLTARGQSRDVVQGLDTGADDYLTKPFSFEVLLARVRALLRRPRDSLGEVLRAADLELDTVAKQAKRAGQPIKLSAKEYALLEYLLRNQDKVLSKNNIMTHVWDFDADILPNTVEVFIAYLRNKVDKPFAGPPLIQTVRGFGYKLDAAS